MLFCFGLFALLLYYTVVANAECSYTYRNSSQQHIEAESRDYERQGYKRCEFLIQLVNTQQQLHLNFTRLTGFGQHAPRTHGQSQGPLGAPTQTAKEKEEEDRRRGGGEVEGVDANESGGPKVLYTTGTMGGTPRLAQSTTPTSRRVVVGGTEVPSSGSHLSSILSSSSSSSSSPRPVQHRTTHTAVAATTTTAATTSRGREPYANSHNNNNNNNRAGPHHGEAACLPMVEILEVVGEGREERRQQICHPHNNTQTPIVFHYASSVRIVYQWQHNHSSGFTLYFDVSDTRPAAGEKCVHTCDGSRCLTDPRKLCNGQADCDDQSDEQTPACSHLSTSSSTPSVTGGESLVTVIVLPACVAVVLVLCVLCVFLRRHWYTLHRTMHRANGHATHLALPQSHSSEGLTPSSTQECNEQAVALLPSAHRSSHKSWHPPHAHGHAHSHAHTPAAPPEPQVGLPPNIPVSPDGEEGYTASQLRLLHPRYQHTPHSHLFKPPPNKTVYDRESPPPYSATPSPATYAYGSAPPASSSSSSSSFSSSSPPVLGRGVLVPAGAERVVRDCEGHAVVSRCYTMCDPLPRRHHHQHHQQHHTPHLHQHNHHQQQQQQRHSAAALGQQPDRQRHHRPPREGGSGGGGGGGSGGFGAGEDHSSSSSNSNNNNNNGYGGRYHQRPPHVHGAFTVKDALHPSAPPPLLVDSSSAGDRTTLVVAPPPPPPPIQPPPHPHPQAVTVMPSSPLCGGTVVWDSDSGSSGGSVGGHPSPDELEAPPSYELALSQGQGGGVVDNNNCQGGPAPLANTSPTSSLPACNTTTTTTAATTTTTASNNSGGAS